MPSTSMSTRSAALIAAGMVILFAGVVAGSFTGNLLRGEEPDPLQLGADNAARGNTALTSNTGSGGALEVHQNGTGTGIRGDSRGGNGGIFAASQPNRSGLIAQNNATQRGGGAALTAQGNRNVGARVVSNSSVALWAESTVAAIYADGPVVVSGDLAIGGVCMGCTLAALTVNGSTSDLEPGDAVTVLGAGETSLGTTVLMVGPARDGQPVVGIVDTPISVLRPDANGSAVLLQPSDEATVEPDGLLRVITSGVVSDAKAAGSVQAGDTLIASVRPGELTAATSSVPGLSIGYALGAVEGGRVAVYVSPY